MNQTMRSRTLLALAVASMLGCQTITNIPAISGGAPTISLYEILGQYAQNQGWSEPEADATCQDLGAIWATGTTCFQPSSPFEENEGLTIEHLDILGIGSGPECWVTSIASIYKSNHADEGGETTSDEYTVTTEQYRNTEVTHYSYRSGDENQSYTRQIYRWYYENLAFTIQEDASGANCQAYSPNTQAFQFLIDLMEQGYVVE